MPRGVFPQKTQTYLFNLRICVKCFTFIDLKLKGFHLGNSNLETLCLLTVRENVVEVEPAHGQQSGQLIVSDGKNAVQNLGVWTCRSLPAHGCNTRELEGGNRPCPCGISWHTP